VIIAASKKPIPKKTLVHCWLRLSTGTMLRSVGSSSSHRLLSLATTPRRRAIAAGAALTTTAGAATTYYYYSDANLSEKTLGLRRQGQFWWRVVPVMADYYWQFGRRSPYVQWLEYQKNGDDSTDFEADKERRKELLHQRHAPTILNVMLTLKGLYVKLGQVLSVTALPIPQAYRERFRTLQSDVPGHEDFGVVEQVLRQELQTDNLDTIFAWIDPVPAGAASIGQAHRARLRDSNDEVVVKVQYPDASWQVPADIQCVGDLLKICVYAGLVDESAANMSFQEFARQFLSELDYLSEQDNLRETYESSLRSEAPYQRRGVVVPRVYGDLSTDKVITMTYLRGPKLEEEALRQLELLGIDTKRGLGHLVRQAARDAARTGDELDEDTVVSEATLMTTGNNSNNNKHSSWKVQLGKRVGQLVGVDAALSAVRWARRILLWSTAVAASTVGLAAPVLPISWQEWSREHVQAYQQAQRLALTQGWIDALFDIHGYQIFQQGLFNADCHPGNILVIEEEDGSPATRLGLIDYGQCKRLTPSEQVRVAELLLSVARKESDEQVAAAFRRLNVQTKNDSTPFLAEMARLMFGKFETEHLDHEFHQRLHRMDRITYFPKELSMVYRTSLLLRGLAVSLQVNASVSEQWRTHAQKAVDRSLPLKGMETPQEVVQSKESSVNPSSDSTSGNEVVVAG